MSELVQIAVIGLVLYAMKALPFTWRFVPRTPLAGQIFDLLPVALLTAMLLPPVLLPLIAASPTLGRVLALAAVAATFCVCIVANRPTLGIGTGLAVLAVAELM